jgi:hypothetical protein
VHPLTPQRVLDTRAADGSSVDPVGPGQRLDLRVTGRAGIPASGVTAVIMNVTATNATATSYLTVWPSGRARPLASNLNFGAGQTVANLVQAPVGGDGRVSIFNFAGSVDLVADVAGWVGSPIADGSGLYQPITPRRAADTRSSSPRPRLHAGETLDLAISGPDQDASLAGLVPKQGVSAVMLNLTVDQPDNLGFLTAYPSDDPRPTASNVNFVAGQTVPNRVLARLGADGHLRVYAFAANLDVVVDVNGWFTDMSSSATSGAYIPVTPSRLLDTRETGSPLSGTSRSVVVAGRAEVPVMTASSHPSAVVLNVTATETTGPGFLTLWPSGVTMPLASDLNVVAGQTVANLVVVRVGPDGAINLFSSTGAQVIVDVLGWYSSLNA